MLPLKQPWTPPNSAWHICLWHLGKDDKGCGRIERRQPNPVKSYTGSGIFRQLNMYAIGTHTQKLKRVRSVLLRLPAKRSVLLTMGGHIRRFSFTHIPQLHTGWSLWLEPKNLTLLLTIARAVTVALTIRTGMWRFFGGRTAHGLDTTIARRLVGFTILGFLLGTLRFIDNFIAHCFISLFIV